LIINKHYAIVDKHSVASLLTKRNHRPSKTQYWVLQSLLASGQTAYIALAVFAVVMSLIGAFYYLRVVKVMYFDAPLTATSVSAPLDVRFVLTLNGALVLVLGLLPGGLMALCADAIVRALAT